MQKKVEPSSPREGARDHGGLEDAATILESITDAFFAMDGAWCFTYVNREAERLLERTRSELLGQCVWDEFPEAVGSAFETHYRHAVATGETVRFEAFYPPLDTHFSVAAYPGEHGISVYFRDITEEHRLRDIRARLMDILETTPDVVAIRDADGRVLYTNRSGLTNVMASPELLSDETLRQVHPEWAAKLVAEVGLPSALRDGSWTGETAILDKDGREIPTSQVILATRNDAGEVASISTIMHDISAMKEREAALRESETRFRMLVEQSLAGIYAIRDGRFDYVNARFAEIFGYTQREIIEECSTRDLVHPEDLGILAEMMRRRLSGEEASAQYGMRGLRKDGSVIHMEVHGSVLDRGGEKVIVGVLLDVTQREQALDELQASEVRYRHLFEHAPIGVTHSDPEGRYLESNAAYQHMLGYTGEELRQLRWQDLTHPDELEENLRLFGQLQKGVIDSYHLDKRYRHRDGHEVWGRNTVGAIRDADGSLRRVVGMVADITRQKAVEQALKESEDQLRQAQKMEAVGRLAGGVAHDFNNMLTAIQGFSTLLRNEVRPGSRGEEYLEEVIRAAERSASLTRQLLAFSRKQVLRPEVLDLNAVVGEMEKMLRRVLGEDIELSTEPDAGLHSVKADPVQVQQVLLNLAVNARDAMPAGGTLSVATGNRTVRESLAMVDEILPPGDYVELQVRDSGSGMSDDVLSRIFEPFFTTKETGRGTGLGLATVHGIVNQSGGGITVESQEGTGTTFRIYLPRHDGRPAAEADGAAPPAPAGGAETVLLVEDESAVRSLVRRTLEEAGYTVLAARDGQEALRRAALHDGAIHLLLTDVVMPGMDGPSLAREVSRDRPDLLVCYMSGHSADHVDLNGAAEEAAGFVEKPFTPAGLLARVREILEPA